MKKITALALALAMALSLVGCGGNTNAGSGSNAGSTSGNSSQAGVDLSNLSVTCVVPYDAGGGTDAVMRGLADAAKGSFKNITVENRSGAGGATGMLYGANAKNDGSIVTMITVELATLEAMGNNAGLTYTMFKPIMMVNSAASAITVRADDDRFNTLEEFIEYSKNNEVSVGNSGLGAIWHLAAAGLAKEADTTSSTSVMTARTGPSLICWAATLTLFPCPTLRLTPS